MKPCENMKLQYRPKKLECQKCRMSDEEAQRGKRTITWDAATKHLEQGCPSSAESHYGP